MELSLAQIDAYIAALCRNAGQLIGEARLLLDAEAFARAYALSHLGREELAKVSMLHATAVRLLAGQVVDFKALTKRLRDHKSKLSQESAHLAFVLYAAGQTEQAEMLFRTGGRLSDVRNNWKNSSLYVGMEDGVVLLPDEQITEAKARRSVELATINLLQQRNASTQLGDFEHRAPTVLPKFDISSVEEAMELLALITPEALNAVLQMLNSSEGAEPD